MDANYSPDQDYNAAYQAALRRLRSGYTDQKANLQQELATNGVRTSGVSAIPEGRLGAAQASDEANLGSTFALEQAHNAIDDRHRSEDFAQEEKIARLNGDIQQAAARRLAQGQLTSSLIGGGLGMVGSYFAGGAKK